MTSMRCSRCSHPLAEERVVFGQPEIFVCETCERDDENDGVTVRARAEGGKPL